MCYNIYSEGVGNMIKAYRIIETTYICGELENSYACNKVLYTDEEAKVYNENHTYIYDTIRDIRKWHRKEFYDNFGARIKILYPIFGSKFIGLYSSKTDKDYLLKKYPNFNVTVKYSLEETTISLEELTKISDSEKVIQYLLERGITMLKELT